MYCVIYWTYFAIYLEKILKESIDLQKQIHKITFEPIAFQGKEKRGIEESLVQRQWKFYQSFVLQILLRRLDQVGKSKVDSFQSPVVMLDWENMNSNWQALIVPVLEAENRYVGNMLAPNYNRYQWVTSRHYAAKYTG